MKVLLNSLAALIVTLAAHAQGTVVFDNRNTAVGLDAPISVWSSAGAGPGPGFSAGLYFNGALVPDSVTTFRTGANPNLQKYIVAKTVALPGVPIDSFNVPVEMRVWLTSSGSYENTPAMHRGSSGMLTVAQVGGGPNPDVANHLPPSFTGFIIFPEPSTIALAFLGGALLLVGANRRK
jgi:hypothetical protein